MLTGLLDTAIVVDLLRSYQPAADWLSSVTGQLGLSPLVWLEVIDGARDTQAQRAALKLLRCFDRVEHQAKDLDWAIESSLRCRLSHGVDMIRLRDRISQPPARDSPLHRQPEALHTPAWTTGAAAILTVDSTPLRQSNYALFYPSCSIPRRATDNKRKVLTRQTYGFRDVEHLWLAYIHEDKLHLTGR
jgi:predicted nucleic acid-binding protein